MPLASSSGAASGGMLASQKHLDHLWLAHGGGKLAFKDFLAGIEHDDAIGDLLDETHEMLDHDDGHAGRRHRLYAPGNPVELGRVEAGGELVEQKQPRPGR